MKRFFYNYQTIIHFDSPVNSHFFRLRCMPCVNTCQQAGKRELFVHPADYVTYGADAWGNPIQYGNRMEPHDSFVYVSSGEARITPYRIPTDGFEEVFKVASPLTAVSPAMKAFAEGGEGKSPLEYALWLSGKIHTYMNYTPGSTQILTPARKAFDQRQGVCQDYAHILIALCRMRHIPVRYVNGFIPGVGATHAWVEVLEKGYWWGVDPTNDRLAEYGYIKLSHGRDVSDCPVNRGIFTGITRQQTEIRVIVEEI